MQLMAPHTENGVSPADLLVSAIEEQRPIVLILGQDAWSESKNGDTILVKALVRLGRDRDSQCGWSTLLGAERVPDEFYDWLAERFRRRVHPPSLEVLTQLPWSAVFTSSLDPTLKELLEGRGRQPDVILTANETPPSARSRARPPLYHLFSRAGEHDPEALPPENRPELNIRRTRHAVTLLNRVLETTTTLGLVVVDGFASGRDWLRIDNLLGVLGDAAPRQVIWFGGKPRIDGELVEDFDAAVKSNRIVVEPRRLGTLVAELRALDRLPDPMPPDTEAPGLISLDKDRRLETTPEERLRVEAVASIVDDSWTEFLVPLGKDSEYATFRRFHGAVEGPRLLVEGVRRGFAIERDFEPKLWRHVSAAIANHARIDTPIMVEGQSGTGKSVALARVVVYARERKRIPVLYAIGRIPRSQEVSKFCELADSNGAMATLIVCDANRDVDDYYDLLIGLRSLGRRVVVLGSRYRKGENKRHRRYRVEAPAFLSDDERDNLHRLLGPYLGLPNRDVLETEHFLAFLYRHLPASRARIGVGLGAEAQSAAHIMSRVSQPADHDTLLLRQRIIESGILSKYPSFTDEPREQSISNSEEGPAKLIDLVMLAGNLSCDVPVNLLIRAVTKHGHDLSLIIHLFQNLDLFRWNKNTLFVGPRLTLEAEVLCRYRFGGADAEATGLIELIESVRDGGIDSQRDERRFLLDLLQQIGPDGIRGERYQSAYVKIAGALTKLRKKHGTVDAGFMIQESTFRRYAIRYQKVAENDCLPLLEEARDVIQLALDGVDDGSIYAARKTKDNLLVERATIYGFLARNRADSHASAEDTWSAYEAARTAIRKAVSVTSAYYPLDIGLWTPSDILRSGSLTELQQADLRADIYSTLDQVEPAALPPQQREKFHERQMRVGAVLRDYHLTNLAFSELEDVGSTAGYFLRARGLISDLSRDAFVLDTPDVAAAEGAAEFLSSHFDKIKDDQRCLRLLLECKWIVETGRWPFRGLRQPVPFDPAKCRGLLAIVRALNAASGPAAQPLHRYLDAMLTWLTDDEQSAIRMFRALAQDTGHEFGGRVISRHTITGADGATCRFQGRVERDRGAGHWTVRVQVGGIDRQVDLLSRSFPNEEVTYGRTIRDFGISFNFIGPIADPVR